MFNCYCYIATLCVYTHSVGVNSERRKLSLSSPPSRCFQRHVSQWIYLKEILIENSINDAARGRKRNHHYWKIAVTTAATIIINCCPTIINYRLSRMMMMMMTERGWWFHIRSNIHQFRIILFYVFFLAASHLLMMNTKIIILINWIFQHVSAHTIFCCCGPI